MPLQNGAWKANIRGIEVDLNIEENSSQITGRLAGYQIQGFWNEASQTITFWLFARQDEQMLPMLNWVFKGFLLGTPPNPRPGQDIALILTGSFLAPPPQDSPIVGGIVMPFGNERSCEYGWSAQITMIR